MPANNKDLATANGNKPAPQYYNPTTDTYEHVKGQNGGPFATILGPNGQPISSTNGLPAQLVGSSIPDAQAIPTKLTGSNVVEQKKETDAVAGTVTFSENIQHLEIYNVDGVNQGVFNVNGINVTVPAGKSFKASFGGTPRATVTVTGSTSYILTRYE